MNSHVFFAAIFASPLLGLFVDRFRRRSLLLTLGSLLLPTCFILLGGFHANLWVVTVLLGLSYSLVPAVLWPAVPLLVEERRLGTAFGLMTMLQNIGLTVCNFGAGWINDHSGAGSDNPAGYGAMLVFFGGLSLSAVVFAALLWVRETGPQGHGLESRV